MYLLTICYEIVWCGNVCQRDCFLYWGGGRLVSQVIHGAAVVYQSARRLCFFEKVGDVDLFQRPLCKVWIVWEFQIHRQSFVRVVFVVPHFLDVKALTSLSHRLGGLCYPFITSLLCMKEVVWLLPNRSQFLETVLVRVSPCRLYVFTRMMLSSSCCGPRV